MKISDNTISILRNFSDINANILFKPGKKLSTVSTMKNIMAEAMLKMSLKLNLVYMIYQSF